MKSILKQSALGCALTVMLLQGAGSVYAQSRKASDKPASASYGGALATATTTQQNDLTGTWHLAIRYTRGDDRPNHVLMRRASPAKDMSHGLAVPNNVGQWITARFIAFRVQEPRFGNLTFVLKQEGEKVTGLYSGFGDPNRLSGAVKEKDVSFSAAVTNNAGEQITARFTGELLSSPARSDAAHAHRPDLLRLAKLTAVREQDVRTQRSLPSLSAASISLAQAPLLSKFSQMSYCNPIGERVLSTS